MKKISAITAVALLLVCNACDKNNVPETSATTIVKATLYAPDDPTDRQIIEWHMDKFGRVNKITGYPHDANDVLEIAYFENKIKVDYSNCTAIEGTANLLEFSLEDGLVTGGRFLTDDISFSYLYDKDNYLSSIISFWPSMDDPTQPEKYTLSYEIKDGNPISYSSMTEHSDDVDKYDIVMSEYKNDGPLDLFVFASQDFAQAGHNDMIYYLASLRRFKNLPSKIYSGSYEERFEYEYNAGKIRKVKRTIESNGIEMLEWVCELEYE